jgi:hypothetical protein
MKNNARKADGGRECSTAKNRRVESVNPHYLTEIVLDVDYAQVGFPGKNVFLSHVTTRSYVCIIILRQFLYFSLNSKKRNAQ